ncbi:hypothetical protein [Jidongwangia harbinensis]|uniref:hypothetical protein n=1 Tax=Jidongwangia harbinensis TaxID=2878561 RepID=UPI001CD9B16D|nr:hypothetical protein [Jidongwangia harbinensis]MCA2211764.1 hypothetical protein [Jidongwangia harbinensis]
MAVSRRSVLAAGLGVAAATTLAGTAPAAPAAVAPDPALLRARRRAMRFLDLTLDAHAASGALRLPQSYADELGLYTTAFTYDAALAALAYLVDDRPESLDRAALIGESLHYAQQHDPRYDDGRLRQAYHAGPYTRNGAVQPDGFVRDDGTVNIGGAFGFVGSGAGEHAWAGIAWCALHQRTGDSRFLASAVAAGRWLAGTCRSTRSLGGFADGFDRDGVRLRRVSTTRNADLAAFFAHLALVTGDQRWLAHRDHATALVRRMWNAPRQAFWHGSADGRVIDRGPLVLEAQTHSWLALRDGDHSGCLDTAGRRLTVTDTPTAPNSSLRSGSVTGLTVSTESLTADPDTPIEPGVPAPDPRAVWLEGTAQHAAALAHSPAGALAVDTAQRALARAQSQLSTAAHVADTPVPAGHGLPAASSPVHVGYLPSGYYPAKHVAATAWLVLALTRTNPLGPDPLP